MTTDPWAIDASGGSPGYSAGEVRLTTVVPHFAGVGTTLGVRSGVRASGSGTDLLVQAQSSPNMTVKVNTGTCVVQGAISATQGAYSWALDALLSSLAISAAHATLSRTDRVCVRIRDANVDTSGARDGAVMVVTGSAGGGVPSLPTDASYMEIARVTIAAADTAINTGDIADKRDFTAALGGIIPMLSTVRPSAAAVAAGQAGYDTDTGAFRISDQSTWKLSAPWRDTRTLGSTTASVSFLPPTWVRYFSVRWMAKSVINGAVEGIFLRVNGLATNIYHDQIHEVVNATVSTTNRINQSRAQIGVVPGQPGGTGTQMGTGIMHFHGLQQTSAQTDRLTWVGQMHTYPTQADSRVWNFGGVCITNPPWTSITINPAANSFAAGTEFVAEGWD